MDKGILIIIEGPDGSGKALQTKMLAGRLSDEGTAVRTLDFPRYDTNQFGALIRECLDGKRGDFMHLDSKIASTLYAADRFESKPVIEGWLAEGSVVLLDRYVSSNMLHQGAKLKDNNERMELVGWLDKIEHGVFGLPRPDMVIYLEIPADIRSNLIAERGAADLSEADTQHQRDADECARLLSTHVEGWTRVSCVSDAGELRSPIDINRELFMLVRKKFSRL